MVKDPQCGMYVATDLAITARSKDQTLHFCSEDCRDKFLQDRIVRTRARKADATSWLLPWWGPRRLWFARVLLGFEKWEQEPT